MPAGSGSALPADSASPLARGASEMSAGMQGSACISSSIKRFDPCRPTAANGPSMCTAVIRLLAVASETRQTTASATRQRCERM